MQRKQTERVLKNKESLWRNRTCKICGARQSEWQLVTRTNNKRTACIRRTLMIMKNSTNFYSKEVTAAMLKVKTEYRMATAMAKLKTATEMRHSLEEQKKTQGRYRDTNPPPSTRKSSRTVSCISIRIDHLSTLFKDWIMLALLICSNI